MYLYLIIFYIKLQPIFNYNNILQQLFLGRKDALELCCIIWLSV